MNPVYLDYAATTPLDARVAAAMQPWLSAAPGVPHVLRFGNAASAHAHGRAARDAVELARAQVAALVGAAARDVVFTSGATEANNLAIHGMAHERGRRAASGTHLVTSRIEHKSVLDPCKSLQREGIAVSLVDAGPEGLVSVDAVRAALRADTRLVSIMHANNETGVIQPIAAIAALCRERGIALHVDAAQSAGKLPLDLAALPVDLLSLSAHKLYGPQGIGALIVRAQLHAVLEPLIYGGGHERGLRSGTLPVHQIVGFGAAAELAARERATEAGRVLALRENLQAAVLALPGALLNGHATERLPGVLNVSFAGLHGETLLHGMPELALSSSAACNSDSDEPSYVLRSLGRDAAMAEASLRFSLGRYTTPEQVEQAIAAVRRAVQWQRARLPEPGSEQAVTPEARVRFELRLEDGAVASASYRAHGCPWTHATCEWLCQRLPGRRAAYIGLGSPSEWAQALAVPAERLGRLLTVEDALQRALEDAKNPVQANT
jgi:cysteine desulfurase